MKYWAGWITSWNQDCQEKYQQPQICRWYHSNGRECRGTEEPLDEGEKGEWKAGLKVKIQKTKIIASSPITSWQIEGDKLKAVTGFIFLGSKITADSDCSHEIKRHLLLGKRAMTNHALLQDFPNPGTEPRSPTLQADSLPSESPRKPRKYCKEVQIRRSWISLPFTS